MRIRGLGDRRQSQASLCSDWLIPASQLDDSCAWPSAQRSGDQAYRQLRLQNVPPTSSLTCLQEPRGTGLAAAPTMLPPSRARSFRNTRVITMPACKAPYSIAALENQYVFRHRSETWANSSTSIREISPIGLSSSVRFKIELRWHRSEDSKLHTPSSRAFNILDIKQLVDQKALGLKFLPIECTFCITEVWLRASVSASTFRRERKHALPPTQRSAICEVER